MLRFALVDVPIVFRWNRKRYSRTCNTVLRSHVTCLGTFLQCGKEEPVLSGGFWEDKFEFLINFHCDSWCNLMSVAWTRDMQLCVVITQSRFLPLNLTRYAALIVAKTRESDILSRCRVRYQLASDNSVSNGGREGGSHIGLVWRHYLYALYSRLENCVI